MAKVKMLHLGSRKRLRQIRWKRPEIIHALLLALVLAAFCTWLVWWVQKLHFD
ncbi:hypothetical protein [Paracidobacterium acidisoli]|uniref:hypothetical protein n=1 Tax=Paracidobacterium acidisoli TaxID=2303751 RepID=UPI001314EB18|nr:hypothetical protein [Paracidobacterium acidisoli]MBT9330599.1 hypothetical protein [Paracidobacterium acidisoli]